MRIVDDRDFDELKNAYHFDYDYFMMMCVSTVGYLDSRDSEIILDRLLQVLRKSNFHQYL